MLSAKDKVTLINCKNEFQKINKRWTNILSKIMCDSNGKISERNKVVKNT